MITTELLDKTWDTRDDSFSSDESINQLWKSVEASKAINTFLSQPSILRLCLLSREITVCFLTAFMGGVQLGYQARGLEELERMKKL